MNETTTSQPARALSRAVVSWVALYLSIGLDVAQVFALDYSDGFANPPLAVAAILAYLGEISLFGIALRHIGATVANGMLGLGTAAVSAISIGCLGEPLTPIKALALLTVIAGSVLLNTEGDTPPGRLTDRTG